MVQEHFFYPSTIEKSHNLFFNMFNHPSQHQESDREGSDSNKELEGPINLDFLDHQEHEAIDNLKNLKKIQVE